MSIGTLKPLHNSHALSGVLVFTGSEGQQILYRRLFLPVYILL